jgi:hypothetical protein
MKSSIYGRIVPCAAVLVAALGMSAGSFFTSQPVAAAGDSYEISFPSAKLDPLATGPIGTIKPREAAHGRGRGYYVIQLNTATEDTILDDLRTIGVEVLQYVPQNAFYVRASAQAMSAAAGRRYVRWAGEFLPEHKISAVLREQLAAADAGRTPFEGISAIERTAANAAIFDVAVFKGESLDSVSDRLMSDLAGRTVHKIELPANYFNVVRAELPLDRVTRAAEIEGVITIDAYGTPRAEDERAAQIVSGNYSNTTTINPAGWNSLTQFGRDGSGVTVAVADDGISIPGNGGFYVTAANTIHGPLRGGATGATGGHGHINASIIAGDLPFYTSADPTGYNYGVGIARKAHIINIPFLAGYTGSEAMCYDDTVTTVGPNGVRGSISNNSWGNGLNSSVYDSYTAQFDGFVRDSSAGGSIDPLSIIMSAGNSGSGASTLTRPKAAKNIVAVGNSENLRTELGGTSANNMDDLINTSSRGPAADGRVKPDIVAPGGYVTGGGAGSGASTFGFVAGTGNNILVSSGTSHAAPQVAGAAALFTQAWKENNGVNPSPALIKAAILNTGQEMTGANVGTALPNGNEGWGRINMQFMLRTGVPMKFVNETSHLMSPGQNVVYTGFVSDLAKPIKVALVWTDPPAAPNANPALVNNLDLTVSIGGTTYRGNVFSNGNSTTGGTGDTLNNIEMVRLPAGIAAGTPVTITVSSAALNGDGILGNADLTDQHFALAAYNFASRPASRADFDGDGRTDVSVYRPAGGLWFLQRSIDGFTGQQFGIATDVPVPGDYDGDGRTDLGVFRADSNPANPDFFVLRSLDNSFQAVPWGTTGAMPVAGDFDGDAKSDIAIYRPSNNTWYIRNSGGSIRADSFGASGDIPLVMDYEGDGSSNIGVYRPSANTFFVARPTGIPSQSFYAVPFGVGGDMPVPADYDGDGSDDLAVFRPSSGIWYVRRSSNQAVDAVQFGSNGDVPVPGDYDGDGRDDQAVFRNGTWYLLRSTAGFTGMAFGLGSDVPVPKRYIP